MKHRMFFAAFVMGLMVLSPRLSLAQNIENEYSRRVMSYNVHGVRGMDGKTDYDRIAQVIMNQNPDFVAIQELDSCCERSGKVYQLEELAKRTRLYPIYGGSINFQGGKYGIGILSKEKALGYKRIPLPGKEPRSLLIAEYKTIVFCDTHLALQEANRLEDMDIILKELAKCTKPVVLCGDWNDTPNSKLLAKVQRELKIFSNQKLLTFPTTKPQETIDYIAGSKDAVALSRSVINESVASDHFPIVADLRFKVPAEKLMTYAPYLQDPMPTSMTVMFQTNVPAHCWVEYGTDSLNVQRARTLADGQEVCYDIENKIVLSNLKPGTKYFYRVCAVDILMKKAYENHFGDTLKTDFHSFCTPSDKDKDWTCLVFNDLHEQYATYNYLRSLVKDVNYDFVVFNGDCLPEPANRAHAMKMIHRLADPIGGADHPIIFIRGNHEIRNAYSAGMRSLIGYHNAQSYGAFSWGDTRLLVLDSGEDKPDSTNVYAGLNDFSSLRNDQLCFIKQEVKSKDFKKAGCRVLFCHIPIWGNGDKYSPCEKMWGPSLANQKFNLGLFAHMHSYRFMEKGFKGVNFPLYYGGGPKIEQATVAVLQKKGDKLHLKVLSKDSQKCLDVDL